MTIRIKNNWPETVKKNTIIKLYDFSSVFGLATIDVGLV